MLPASICGIEGCGDDANDGPAGFQRPLAETGEPASTVLMYLGTSATFWTKPSAKVKIEEAPSPRRTRLASSV